MHTIYLLARTYPYWALGILAILFQLTVFFRRRKNNKQYVTIGLGVLTVLGIFFWFFFRGDLYSDKWVRALLGD